MHCVLAYSVVGQGFFFYKGTKKMTTNKEMKLLIETVIRPLIGDVLCPKDRAKADILWSRLNSIVEMLEADEDSK